MSEITSIDGNASISNEILSSSNLTEERVKELLEEGNAAIKEKIFLRSAEIITLLCEAKHQAYNNSSWTSWLFSMYDKVVSFNELTQLYIDYCYGSPARRKRPYPSTFQSVFCGLI